MKAYGMPNKKRYNYIDNHPKKGFVNWWEVEIGCVDKKRARQQVKKEIDLDIYDHYYGVMHLEMSDYWDKEIN